MLSFSKRKGYQSEETHMGNSSRHHGHNHRMLWNPWRRTVHDDAQDDGNAEGSVVRNAGVHREAGNHKSATDATKGNVQSHGEDVARS